MALLDDAISASGGLEQWRRFRRFTFHVSIQGSLLAGSGAATHLKDAVVEGCIQTQWVRLTCFSGTDKCAVYRPDQVSIESIDGTLLELRNDPRAALLSHGDPSSWDDLDIAYVCGLSIWNFVASPFLLTHPGIQVQELSPWHERNETWGRLRAVFPDDIVTLSREQIFYFDAAGLLRRTDHEMPAPPERESCITRGRTRRFRTSSSQLYANPRCCCPMAVSSPNQHSSTSRSSTPRSTDRQYKTLPAPCGRAIVRLRACRIECKASKPDTEYQE